MMQHKKNTNRSNQQKLNVKSQLFSIVKALHVQETELCHLEFLFGVFRWNMHNLFTVFYMYLSKIAYLRKMEEGRSTS